MARPILLSNGELHVGINKFGEVHDFYYPYVGLENHAAGKLLRHHVGVWVDGKLSWFDDGEWEFEFSYPHESLIGHIVAKNHTLEIMLELDDVVDAEFSALMRNVHIINMSNKKRDVRLFMHQAFVIGDTRSNTDTAQYLPDVHGILHYQGRRAFLVSAQDETGKPFDQYTVGLFGIEDREGTYRDAEDGELQMCAVEHGRVDSTIRFQFDLAAHSSQRIHYWVACGTSTREVLYIHKQILSQTVHHRYRSTSRWWHNWLKPAKIVAAKIDDKYRDEFLRSVMLIKAHTDKHGAVIASTDSSMLNYWRDAYAYCWPRDASYVLWPLMRMGYEDEAIKFFEFARRALNPGGYLMHKYRADGALGSSWHPYVHDNGVVAAPIQEDETAITLFVFSQYYHLHPSESLLKSFYATMVVPMADFLENYVDRNTGLPKPSYDLWEEQFMTTTYTTAVTYAALLAAADLAEIQKDDEKAVKWRSAAEDMQSAAHKQLYNHKRKAFYKGIRVDKDGTVTPDETIDLSSAFGVFMYGLFAVESDEVHDTMETIRRLFKATDKNPGLPRYEDDAYRRENADITGNWWFVTTLWMAQYDLETGNAKRAEAALEWVQSFAGPTGILGEQIDPHTGLDVSVSPLCWSQAEFVSTLIDTVSEDAR